MIGLAVAITISGIGLSSPSAHSAVSSPSPGCNQMNSSTYDADYAAGPILSAPTYRFARGEKLVVRTSAFAGSAATMGLTIVGSSTTSQTTTVLGTLTHTLVEDLDTAGMYVNWNLPTAAGAFNATWVVECIPFTASAPEPQAPFFPEHLQQVNRAQNTECTQINLEVLEWGREIAGGWGPSWAQWANGGLGGPVCSRTIYFDSRLRVWAART